MAWSLIGTYFESCNCDVVCRCIFLSPPNGDDCTALVGWHIDKGNDEGVELSGLNVALAVHAPGHMATTPWNVAVYVDERASKEQHGSLMKIFGGQDGGHPARLAAHIGAIVGAKSVAIEFSINGGKYALKIPNIADVEIEQMNGQGDGPITVTGHPLCIAPGFPATAAKSTRLSYADHDMAWELTEKSGIFSPFAYQSEQ